MRVEYDFLGGAMPVYDALSNPCVHVWVPRRGWVQQVKGGRVIVSLQRVKADRFRSWVEERLGKLGVSSGFVFVPVRDHDPEYVLVGLAHDRRRPRPLNSWSLGCRCRLQGEAPYLPLFVSS